MELPELFGGQDDEYRKYEEKKAISIKIYICKQNADYWI